MGDIDALENNINLVLIKKEPTIDELKYAINTITNYLESTNLDLDEGVRFDKLMSDTKKKLLESEKIIQISK